jgi:hypothetical protein
MKRHGFKGGPASHGSSKFHRKAGSIGQTGLGKVMKGKKMAGRHGGQNTTVFNLQVYKIDVQRNLVYLLGAVPGPQGGIVRMVDSKKATTNQQMSAMYDLPLPTWLVRSTVQLTRHSSSLAGEISCVYANTLHTCVRLRLQGDGEEDSEHGNEVLMPLGEVDPLQMDGI